MQEEKLLHDLDCCVHDSHLINTVYIVCKLYRVEDACKMKAYEFPLWICFHSMTALTAQARFA